MSRELITSWGDYQTAIDRLLSIARQKIRAYDEDLAQFKLESASRMAKLWEIIQGRQPDCLLIIVRNAEPLRQHHPILMKLLADFGHLAHARQSPDHLAHLRDSMLLIDDTHALIRFERDLPRSKLLIDEPDELRPYCKRFAELSGEGGDLIIATPLGL